VSLDDGEQHSFFSFQGNIEEETSELSRLQALAKQLRELALPIEHPASKHQSYLRLPDQKGAVTVIFPLLSWLCSIHFIILPCVDEALFQEIVNSVAKNSDEVDPSSGGSGGGGGVTTFEFISSGLIQSLYFYLYSSAAPLLATAGSDREATGNERIGQPLFMHTK
jgi:hypothetical protein